LLPKLEDTIKLALVLQNAGCQVPPSVCARSLPPASLFALTLSVDCRDCLVQLLAVHGRTRESNSRGPADWAAIRQIK
jgi:tRNA-dihydrouridine synthase